MLKTSKHKQPSEKGGRGKVRRTERRQNRHKAKLFLKTDPYSDMVYYKGTKVWLD